MPAVLAAIGDRPVASTNGPVLSFYIGESRTNARLREAFVNVPSDLSALEQQYPLLLVDMQAEVFAVARQIAAAGVTVLVVEQNVHGALLVSDTAIVMELGRKFLEGPAAEVREDPRIREAYLGGNIKETIEK